jgi:DNA-binding NarL/FixJ family response regulator
VTLARIVQGTMDESIRVRWLKGPIGSRLVALAGEPVMATPEAPGQAADLGEEQRQLMVLLTEGLTNREIADRLSIPEDAVTSRLADVMVTLGAADRAQATSLAMRGLGAGLPSGAGVGQGLT